MTDLTPELDPMATCPTCGAQVSVPAASGLTVACWSCGSPVESGPRDHARDDLTNDEVLRSLATKGYDTEVAPVEPDGLQCGDCAGVSAAGACPSTIWCAPPTWSRPGPPSR
jgi:endogenous inhibitor of DNA gyrase (YacG/DUF329 family)